MQRKRLYTILSAIVFIGLLSVLGAFFVDHEIRQSCLFGLTDCSAMLGTINQALHHLEALGTYFGGVAASPLVFLTLIALALTAVFGAVAPPVFARLRARTLETFDDTPRAVAELRTWLSLFEISPTLA
jgi:hypothetical protein